jgi:DNA-binding NtrC family response regulator
MRKILVIDDEVSFLVPTKKMLEGPSRAVDTADTLDEALRLLGLEFYDVVIADVRLGGSMGSEGLLILEYVRKNCAGTRVILITGFGGPNVMRDAYALKADYYFEKPVSPSRLAAALDAMGVK